MGNWVNQWSVSIDGRDISSGLRPYLINIKTTDKAGTSSDTCSITVDDTAGQFRLPNEKASIVARLNGVKVFEGTVDSVNSTGSRSAGRTLTISAKGYDTKGKAKEPHSFHKDNATLGDFLKGAADKSGFSIKVDDELASIQREYWASDGESFVHLGQRLAREFYGTFKLRGTQAVFAKRGQSALGTITGDLSNVISWSIKPLTGRAIFKASKVRYFDREKAEFEEVEESFDTERPADSINTVRTIVKDKAQAESTNDARKRQSEREGGEGTVTLDAAPEAQVEGMFKMTCARPGVNGTYTIESVSHSGDRNGGTVTTLELKQPQGGAGKDAR